jgi:adenosylmethionine-8-amino-7-oxononanoate aminotransferase
MTGFVVLGTDTDAGKTAFCAQWLTAFSGRFAYWKPVETGASDTETIHQLVPSATLFPPLARFAAPVAPVLAAAREGRTMPGVGEVLAAVPTSPLPLVVETFGGPLSPFTEETLQTELLVALELPAVLVTSSTVGAVGRALQALAGMKAAGVRCASVVLLGPPDAFAVQRIEQHARAAVFALRAAEGWTSESVQRAAATNAAELNRLLTQLGASEGDGLHVATRLWPVGDRRQARGLSPHEGHRRAEAQLRPSSQPHECAELIRRDRAAVWHPYTSLAASEDPLPVVGAEAEYLELADGRKLIDGISSWWTILYGHRHPPLVAALREASDRFDHVLFAGATHPPGVRLAEQLLASAPWRGGRVFFSDNGSTAVEVALKMAYQAWCHRGESGRKLFIGFEHGYHGDTFGAMAVGRDPLFFGRFEPLLFRTLRVPVSADRLAAALMEHRGEVAAVILEPCVQGAGGMRMHAPTDLREIWTVAREHGVFFIADEVMTGCGRTGSPWAFEQAGIAPDLICAAKTLAGGLLPLAATLAAPEIVSAFETDDRTRTFFHGHSFTGHPLACAVAVANWTELETGHWREDVQRIEAVWRARLLPLRTQPGVADVRICGTIGALEFDAPGGYLAEVGRHFRQLCLDHGVFLRPLGNVLYTIPPFRTRTEALHRIADAMTACVRALSTIGRAS